MLYIDYCHDPLYVWEFVVYGFSLGYLAQKSRAPLSDKFSGPFEASS